MKISVIVSTYNQPRFLDLVLHGYGVQTDSDFDVIVADDGSGSETAELIESHKKRWPYALHHVWQEDEGFRKGAILNKAIAASDADYLIFTDGDCIPKRNFVEMHRDFSEPGRYIVGARSCLPRSTTQVIRPDDVVSGRVFNPLWLAARGYWLRRYLRVLIPSRIGRYLEFFGSSGISGNNASCFRADALAVGGFLEKIGYGGEDGDFNSRLKSRGLVPKRMRRATFVLHLHHDHPYVTGERRKRRWRLLLQARDAMLARGSPK